MTQVFRKVLQNNSPNSVETHGDRTHLIQLVTTWGDVNDRDLQGQFFVKGVTDFGDRDVKMLKAFFEHMHNPDNNPYNPLDVHYIGPAILEKVDDMGRWFRFEIERANRYHDYLLKLNEMGLLGASTQAFPGGVEIDNNGAILRWIESEVGPTPTPADPKTIGQVIEVAKSFNIEIPSSDVIVVGQTSKSVPQQIEDILSAPSIEDVEVLDASANQPQKSAQEAQNDAIFKKIESILNQYVEQMMSRVSDRLNAIDEILMSTQKSLVEIKQSQIVLARSLAAQQIVANEQPSASSVEKAVAQRVVRTVVQESIAQFPPDAPGS